MGYNVNDTVYFAFIEFEGGPVQSGTVVKVTTDSVVVKGSDGLTYTLFPNNPLDENFLMSKSKDDIDKWYAENKITDSVYEAMLATIL